MKYSALLLFLVLFGHQSVANAQSFTRSVLPVNLNSPWELFYGPDNYLWVSEERGVISRVHPETGTKQTIYEAPDFYDGESIGGSPVCDTGIESHTFGLALHPDFMIPDSAFVYLFYTSNQGTMETPETKFKIRRLLWDAGSESIIEGNDIVTDLPNGLEHWGGRMLAVKQNGKNYLYFSYGDLADNDPGCYDESFPNPILQTQNVNTVNGKIHRVYMDGSIPEDNPISGNSFFTRGHRNPQGLAYNPNVGLVYNIEHGHTTDDEVNVLYAGMNYGWANVHGYHDGNIDGETDFVNSYTAHPQIADDALIEPLFSWGAESAPTGGFLSWPTVAPSDGIYYDSPTIPEWTNSLLVVTLKNGDVSDQEVYQLKLTESGDALVEPTVENPNPRSFFGEDQEQNGRLRDIAISPDGSKIFLIPNNRGESDPIIVYTYVQETSNEEIAGTPFSYNLLQNYPNPFNPETSISFDLPSASHITLTVFDVLGRPVEVLANQVYGAGQHSVSFDASDLPSGMYMYRLSSELGVITRQMMLVK